VNRRWTKAKLENLALEVRGELGLGQNDPLDPYRLADEYGIPIYPIDSLPEFGCSERAIRHFAENRPKAWSAALIPVGTSRLIIENTAHAPVRRRTNTTHEMSHVLLEHDFDNLLLTDDGCRRYDPTKERQATELAGELLIPTKAAINAAFANKTNAQVASHFEVSIQFAQMRMAGARKIAERAIQKRTGNLASS
jgi:Zn-dependent peptidase ImmA (M78 family)